MSRAFDPLQACVARLLATGDSLCDFLTQMKPLAPCDAREPLDFESFATEDGISDETADLVQSWRERAAQVREAFNL
jgi:hypothetical protein